MGNLRFTIGVAIVLLGYTALYSGVTNLTSGGHGTSFLAALGVPASVNTGGGSVGTWAASVANDVPNLTGNTPQKAASPSQFQQGLYYFGPG